MLQPLIQKIGNKLPGWKRNLLAYPGREFLVKTVLSAMPTFFMTVFKMLKWAYYRIDRFRRSFLWRGGNPDMVNGCHCLVNWQTCVRPRKWGGLGIKDLDKFDRALRLMWLWFNWDLKERPWRHLLKVTDATDITLFFCSIVMQVGNGHRTPF
jgi:hypothetical protein